MKSGKYKNQINLLIEQCHELNSNFNFNFGVDNNHKNGRLESYNLENIYLQNLKKKLEKNDFIMEISKERHWYDMKINDIPMNLKLSSFGGADNAFNKKSILYSIRGDISNINYGNMNNKEFFEELKKKDLWKNERNIETEYHFLVINKLKPSEIIIKSLFDIKKYISNPTNILQVEWKKELKNIDYTCDNIDEKISQLLKTIQLSYRKKTCDMENYVNCDIDDLVYKK